MHTLKIELEDNIYQNIIQSGIDIQEKVKEYLFSLVDDGYPSISTEEAKSRIEKALLEYKNNPSHFKEADESFFTDTHERLLQRYNKK